MKRLRVFPLFGCAVLACAMDATAQDDRGGWASVRGVVFFPPIAPIYGAPIEERHSGGTRIIGGRRLSPPDGLAEFVADDFYPPLSSRLFVPELASATESRINVFRERKLTLITELLNQFVALDQVAPAERERTLRAFAETQSPQIVALEAEADRLRTELIGTGLNRVDWNAGRRWNVGTLKPGSAAPAEGEFQVVRAAAFYQSGLLPAQRGLVRELAIELRSVAYKARGLPGTPGESDAMFFSPETSRFRLPADMSPELRDKAAIYNREKARIKRELRETISATDGMDAATRTRVFEELADLQWPPLRELDELADGIRRLLRPGFEVATPPAPPWMPAGLMQAIRSYNEDRDTFFGELKNYTDAAVAMVEAPGSKASADERLQQQRDHASRQAETRRWALAEFRERHMARYRALEQRYKEIRDTLALVAEKQIDRKTGRPLDADTLLRQYSAAMAEFDTFGREVAIYTHYRMAMLQPGLSPEQRRLLFGYAIVGLAQPLPNGELMPRRTAKAPYPSW